jgi:GAF domain-containing protein
MVECRVDAAFAVGPERIRGQQPVAETADLRDDQLPARVILEAEFDRLYRLVLRYLTHRKHRDGPFGLGFYTIRFTLSDGATVDVGAYYPPSTLAEREAIFRELRKLKSQLCFEVIRAWADASNAAGQVWGRLRYTLADGRAVGTTERIPPEVVSEDGRCVILPGAEEAVEVQQAR